MHLFVTEPQWDKSGHSSSLNMHVMTPNLSSTFLLIYDTYIHIFGYYKQHNWHNSISFRLFNNMPFLFLCFWQLHMYISCLLMNIKWLLIQEAFLISFPNTLPEMVCFMVRYWLLCLLIAFLTCLFYSFLRTPCDVVYVPRNMFREHTFHHVLLHYDNREVNPYHPRSLHWVDFMIAILPVKSPWWICE